MVWFWGKIKLLLESEVQYSNNCAPKQALNCYFAGTKNNNHVNKTNFFYLIAIAISAFL